MAGTPTSTIEWTIYIWAPYGGQTEPPLKLDSFQAYDHSETALVELGKLIRRHKNKLNPDCRVELKRKGGTTLHTIDQRPTVSEFYR